MSLNTSPYSSPCGYCAGTMLLSASNPLIRSQFPSLDRPAIFFDNPGGTQIARVRWTRCWAFLTRTSNTVENRKAICANQV